MIELIRRQLVKMRNDKGRRPSKMRVDYRGDGLGVRRKNLGFLDDPKFIAAWERSKALNAAGWTKVKGGVPDIRWRAHVCCWAAQQGLNLEGDFVECGVHTGILSLVVCDYLNFSSVNKSFWLFDTFEGIPLEDLSGKSLEYANGLNKEIYSDVFEIAKRNFSEIPNAHLIKGRLPSSLSLAPLKKISYLSIDLNNAVAEKSTIDSLWDKISPGGLIVIDDYAFQSHEEQYRMWNDFASQKGKSVLTLPTGQGLLVR